VGHAAIQLAKWAGAVVITTVSSPAKAALVRGAGAHHIVNYKESDAAAEIRRIAPESVETVHAAPMCAKNEAYAQDVAERLRLGESPSDFPKEDYETDWDNRFKENDLNEFGARGLGITRRAKQAERSASI
jgi:NADPH-dependent curcumin reductase CurA